MNATVVMTTCSPEEAEGLADALVRRRVAACVQATSVRSTYEWDGEVHHDAEVLLLIKTAADRVGELEAAIAELHSYDLPELVAVDVSGSEGYVDWLITSTR